MAENSKPPVPLAAQSAIPIDPRKKNRSFIYRTMMRSGGEPFGAPFEAGLATLTEKVIKLLKHTGFFGFETMERLRRRNLRNKFTRHGAAPFVGDHRSPPKRGS